MGISAHELRSFTLIAVGFSLVSCTKAPEPPHTVTYYREHADERRARVEQCADDPGTRGKDPDCVNAKQAAAIEDIGSFRDLGPLGLLPPKKSEATPEPQAPSNDQK